MSLLPRDTLLFEAAYTRDQILLPAMPEYVANTVGTRISDSFSPTLFVKGFVQYNDARKQASLNLLFWSIYRPGSDFYVVCNEGWDTVPGPRVSQDCNRSLAVKLTCWLSR